jgi:hypothetical protein
MLICGADRLILYTSSHSHRIRVKLRTGLPQLVFCCLQGGVSMARSGSMIWCSLGQIATMFRPSQFYMVRSTDPAAAAIIEGATAAPVPYALT